MNTEMLLDKANEAFQRGNACDALSVLAQLPGKDDDGAAILLEGMIYEYGGRGLEADLAKALRNYRKVAVLAPTVALPCLYIARVLMKSGGTEPTLIRRWLDEASRIHHDADVDLAFAAFYEKADDPDLRKARMHFRRAALSGRYAGFFGVSRVFRKQGMRVPALVVDVLRILMAPLLLLVVGRRAMASFDGY